MKLNIIITALVGIFLVLLVFFSYVLYFRFLPIFHHERITISLPFAPEDDDLIFINPMGEKVMHPDSPHGHPGLDFAWHHPAPLLAVIDGKLTSITEHKSGGFGETGKIYDVELVSGAYAIRYTEIFPAPHLKVGMRLTKGDVIGTGGEYKQPPGGLGTYYSTHWEFDYDTPIFDRLCPLTYFDPDSLARINAIWAKVGQTYDGQYPDICSGAYKGKDI